MEAILALLGGQAVQAILKSDAGQALMTAGINQVVSIFTGTDPVDAAAEFANAVQARQSSVTEWQRAEAANPPTA